MKLALCIIAVVIDVILWCLGLAVAIDMLLQTTFNF